MRSVGPPGADAPPEVRSEPSALRRREAADPTVVPPDGCGGTGAVRVIRTLSPPTVAAKGRRQLEVLHRTALLRASRRQAREPQPPISAAISAGSHDASTSRLHWHRSVGGTSRSLGPAAQARRFRSETARWMATDASDKRRRGINQGLPPGRASGWVRRVSYLYRASGRTEDQIMPPQPEMRSVRLSLVVANGCGGTVRKMAGHRDRRTPNGAGI